MIERCPVANGALVTYDRRAGAGRAGCPRTSCAFSLPGVRRRWGGRRLHAARRSRRHRDEHLGGVAGAAERSGRRSSGTSVPTRPTTRRSFARTLKIRPPARERRPQIEGRLDDAFAQAGRRRHQDARYYVPHLAQTPMEPPVAIALFQNGKMEVWAPTQNPDVRAAAARAGRARHPVRTDARRSVQKKVAGGGDGAHDAAGRRLRTQVEARLHRRGGHARQADARRADPRAVDARGRHQIQLLQRRQQSVPEGVGRRGQTSTALLQRSALTSFFGTLFPNYSTPPA